MSSLVARASLGLASVMRSVGTALDSMGKGMEVTKYTEKLVPSTRFVAVDGVAPTVSEQSFVAPSASLIGNVQLGKESSVWYGAVVRGDVNSVSIGSKTSIGDRAVVHVAKIQGDFATSIGDQVTVGAGALIHAATLQNQTMIGEGAQVLDGAIVESESIVAPGSIVTPGTAVKSGEYWAGTPAKMVRVLTDVEKKSIVSAAAETVALALQHAVENEKDYKQVLEEEELADIEMYMDEMGPKREPRDVSDIQGQGQPGRIFRSTLSHPEELSKTQQKQ